METQVIKCRCGHILGTTKGDLVIVRHKGRKVVAHSVVLIVCEACGREWIPDTPQAAA